MSLKAKLEAVIYASEEPVTLNQLAALFAADALEWKASQEAAAAEQTAEVAGVSPDAAATLPLIVPAQESYIAAETRAEEESGADATAASPVDACDSGAGQTASAVAPPINEVISVGEAAAYPSITVEGDAAPAGAAAAADNSGDAQAPATEPAPADPESEAKRLARQRDREVKAVLKQLLDELIAGSQSDGRGIEIREIAGGYRMATKPECHDAVRLFVKSLKPPLKLSLPALETLAVVAYKQPVTAPEVSEIRGVESAGVLGSLLARKLIATAGRKPVIGRPILYKTTKEFLLRFGLKDVSELPSMEEFEKMAATELDIESEPADGAAAEQNAEQNAEANLESNSPSGTELAGAADAVEEAGNAAEERSGASAENGAESPIAASKTAAETGPAEPSDGAESAEPGAETGNEANHHAQESHHESAQKG